MRRGVVLLNLALAAAIGLSAWQMHRQYHSTLARQRQYLSRTVPAPLPPLLTLPPAAPPIQAVTYYPVAAQLPFSPDRNPTVVIEVAPPKPMPPLPGYHGMMNLGEGPRVILSANGLPQRSYQIGQTIGEFKLVAVAQSGLVFEWDGKQVPAGYAEMAKRAQGSAPSGSAPSSGAPPTATPAAVPTAAPAAPAGRSGSSPVTAVGAAGAASSPGSVMGSSTDSQGMRECVAGDSTPDGAIVDGYKKVNSKSPFGTICRWVPVR